MRRTTAGGGKADGRLLDWFVRTERAVLAALAVLMLLLVLFQLMPFSPAIRSVLSETERLEGEPTESRMP